MLNEYGVRPQVIWNGEIKCQEVLYFLYLPISLPRQIGFTLPKSLLPFSEMVKKVQFDEPERFESEHVYITAKRMYVGPSISANRPGWHSDGFGTDDLNYVWCDSLPTVFNNGPFLNISKDDKVSLKQFAQQAIEADNYTFPSNSLLKLDSRVVHRVAENPDKQFIRTFVKISLSKHQYDLDGNSINYDLDYSWKTKVRGEDRNSPHVTPNTGATP